LVDGSLESPRLGPVCDQLRTCLRAGSSHLDSNLVADRFEVIEAKFHYAILVAGWSEAGRRPLADLLARASSLLAS